MNKVKNDPIPNISAARKIEIESAKLKPALNSVGVRPKETVTSNISQPSRDLEDSYALLMHRLTGKNKGSDV